MSTALPLPSSPHCAPSTTVAFDDVKPNEDDDDDDNDDTNNYRNSLSHPDRPERIPTVDLSSSPIDTRIRNNDDNSNDHLTSPSTPQSISRTCSHDDDDNNRDLHSDRNNCKESNDVQNGDELQRNKQQLNNYNPDIKNIYNLSSTDKKSACDSKLTVDMKNLNNQQQQLIRENKDVTTISGIVGQLQRGFTATINKTTEQEQESSANIVQSDQETRETSALIVDEDVEQ